MWSFNFLHELIPAGFSCKETEGGRNHQEVSGCSGQWESPDPGREVESRDGGPEGCQSPGGTHPWGVQGEPGCGASVCGHHPQLPGYWRPSLVWPLVSTESFIRTEISHVWAGRNVTPHLGQSTSHWTDEETVLDRGRDLPRTSCVWGGQKQDQNSDLLPPNPRGMKRGPESAEPVVRAAWDPVPILLVSPVGTWEACWTSLSLHFLVHNSKVITTPNLRFLEDSRR